MRDDVAEADRRYEVREAARGWERAGVIDEATRTKVDAAYPDDRNRLGPVFRVLVFAFTLVVLQSALGIFGLVFASAGETAVAVLLLLCGLSLAALTEAQIGAFRRRQGGSEAATAFLAVLLVIGASLWLFYKALKPTEDLVANTALVLGMLVLGAAAYRWGYALLAGLSAIAAFILLARAPFGRLLWMIVPLALAPPVLRASDSPVLAPSHRRSCQAVAAVALVSLYLAVHLASWDEGLVEMLAGHSRASFGAPRPFRLFFAVATALVPVLALASGIRSRRRLLLDLGLAGLVASIATLRAYVHVAPLWLALILGGGTAISLALLLRLYLDSGARRERGGFTAEPVFTDPERRSALELAASVASFTPAPRSAAPAGFQGGGGRSGGGGATGKF